MVLLASTYDQSKYLKSQDVQGEKRLRIKAVTEEDVGVGKDKQRKLVVWFDNDKRGLVLNITNNRVLRNVFGDACDAWAGKVIVVYSAMTEFRGEMKPGLRVRIPPPKAAMPAPEPEPDPDFDDEIEI
jgi:hypothetical protein